MNSTETWEEMILQGIVLGSCIISSGWRAYSNLKNVEKKFFMDSVVHERNVVELQYNKMHTQNVENKRMQNKALCQLKEQFGTSRYFFSGIIFRGFI